MARCPWQLAAALGLTMLAAGCSDLLELDEFSSPSTTAGGTATATGGSGDGGRGGHEPAGGGGSGGNTVHPSHLLVFVTDEDWPGDLGSPDTADELCRQEAEREGTRIQGQREWKAWLSIDSEGARERVLGDGPWHMVDNTRVFADRGELTSGDGPSAGISLDQFDENETGQPVWTGTDAEGYTKLPNCNEWLGGNAYEGLVGTVGATGPGWTDSGDGPNCLLRAHLYCFEQEP